MKQILICIFHICLCNALFAEHCSDDNMNGVSQTKPQAITSCKDDTSSCGAIISKPFSSIGTLHPYHTSKLSSRATGRVKEVLVDMGDIVTQGQTLLTLESLLYEIDVAHAEAELKTATIEYDNAERNFQRMEKLWNKPEGINPSISKKRFEDAQVTFELAKAHVVQAQQALKKTQALLNETSIKAPYDGTISHRWVHPGEFITADSSQKLLEIETTGKLYVEFSMPQTLLSHIHVGTKLLIHIDAYNKEQLTTQIDSISPHIDEKTRSVSCRATINNVHKLLPSGALVTVQVDIGA